MTTPKLPSLRELTRQLKDLHEAWSHPDAGGEYARLCLTREWPADCYPEVWGVHAATQIDELYVVAAGENYTRKHVYGWEYVPGTRECPTCAADPEYVEWCTACDGTGHVPTPFDATAAARRLLAAARDGGVR